MGRKRKVIPAPFMTCTRCDHLLPMASFRETRKGFYDSSCIDCRREENRKRMQKYKKKRGSAISLGKGEYEFVFDSRIKYG